jgi:hypothetical protein
LLREAPSPAYACVSALSDGGFNREIGKSTIYFLDGEVVLRKQQLTAKPFSKVKQDKCINRDFLTMDIETIKPNGSHIPYLISAYTGHDYITTFAQYIPCAREGGRVIDQKELVNNFMNQLLNRYSKSKRLNIYAHNLGGFDGIFLMKHLIEIGKVVPLIPNGRLISIEFTSSTGLKILFKDSYLMLPMSLRKLCLAFNIIEVKSYFPYLFNDIFYKGVLPLISYWSNITLEEYENLLQKYTDNKWDFKEEAIKYCNLDCKVLHEILSKFNELIFSEFKINMNKCLTLPALAVKIFRCHYMPADTIYQILSDVESNIRSSYSGGAVDVYINHNRSYIPGILNYKITEDFKKLFYYDVNSLYPTVMANANMPVGKPVYFEGDILKSNPEAFGFFYCKIASPQYLEHPILQRRIKTSNGTRTIAGLGN